MTNKHEFWHPRLFEAPYYLYLGLRALLRGIGIRSLAKADYCLDHGEIGIGSKYETQMAFAQERFLPMTLLPANMEYTEKERSVREFSAEHGFPVILKPDIGCVGKGIIRVADPDTLSSKLPLVSGDTIVQKYTPFNFEYGVFYVRHGGQHQITGINRKHFPTVMGNGADSLQQLVARHPRHNRHWDTFLQYHDLERVLPADEKLQLSFIGSHTMGCMFTDDSHLQTDALVAGIAEIFHDQPGFNFGRLDVKAASEEAFQAGDFVVIEVNGVASLPTHMFDPKYSLRESYKIFLAHADHLVRAAHEHRHIDMDLLPYGEIIKRVKANQQSLNAVHNQLMGH